MRSNLLRSLVLAAIGVLLGLGLVVALYGGGELTTRLARWRGGAEPPRPAAGQGPAAALGTPPAPKQAVAPPEAGRTGPEDAPPGSADAGTAGARSGEGQAHAPAEGTGQAVDRSPRFDIVRVEPDGEAVVAGRGLPNRVVEMLVDGKPVARALADPNGQFAIVPPALAPGSSEIVLRSTDADGRETHSHQSVAVAVSAQRDTKPLVALTSPDTPTVVLSQSDATPAAPARRETADGSSEPDAPAPATTRAPTPARIVSVDAQDGGRLYVTGEAAPGATVRLYLNDTLIAPASVGPDGKVTFTIGRGVQPGDYTVRIDAVDPVTGKVRTRAEVPLAVPVNATTATSAPGENPMLNTGTRVATRSPEGASTRPVAGSAAPAPVRGAARPAIEGGARTPGATTAPNPPGPSVAALSAPEPVRARPPADTATASDPARPPVAATQRSGSEADTLSPPGMAGGPAGTGIYVEAVNTARIARGDSLWQISKRTYGKGGRYTVIYDANQTQIRNPDRIYPGQIFVLPGDDAGLDPPGGKRG